MVNFLLLVIIWVSIGLFGIPYLISNILLKIGYGIDPQKERKSSNRSYRSYPSEIFEKVVFGIQAIPLFGVFFTNGSVGSVSLYAIICVIQIFMISIFGQTGKCYSWVFKFKDKNMYRENNQKYVGKSNDTSNRKSTISLKQKDGSPFDKDNPVNAKSIDTPDKIKKKDLLRITKSVKSGYEALSNIKSTAEDSLKSLLIKDSRRSNISRVGLPIFSDIDPKKNQLITVIDNIINEEDAVLLCRSRSLPIISGISSFLLDSKYNFFLNDSIDFILNENDLFIKELEDRIDLLLEEFLQETTLLLLLKDVEDVYAIGVRINRLSNKDSANEKKVILRSMERAVKEATNLSKEDRFLFYITSYSKAISISQARDIVQTYGNIEELMYVNTENNACCFNIPKYYLVMNNEMSQEELPRLNEYIRDSIVDNKKFISENSFIDCVCTDDKRLSIKRYSLTESEYRNLIDFYNSDCNVLITDLKCTDFRPKKLITFFNKVFEKPGIDSSSIGFSLGKQRALNGNYALNVLTSRDLVGDLKDKVDYLGYLFSTKGGSIFEKFQLPNNIVIFYNLSKEETKLSEEEMKFKEALLVPIEKLTEPNIDIYQVLSYSFLNEIYKELFNEFCKGIGDDDDIVIGSSIQACKRIVSNQTKLWLKYYGLDFSKYQKHIIKEEVYDKINSQISILQRIYENKIKVKSECRINENLWKELTEISFPGVNWDKDIDTLDFKEV